ncbi:MAG: aminotransferase class III-fold pyridoxal phosphate-dependent enzyme, partial [Bdellovibrionales bacterium]|nr:aminotransferase class III-fold pyridoxal phosphate-dependent enzyme [Bdellovibrionales bacterium]
MTHYSPLVDTYPQYPFEIVSGNGMHVTDAEGNIYLDLYGGHAVCGIGHSHPHLVAAIYEQAQKLFFYSNLTRLSIRTRAAEELLKFANSHLASVFFCNSGAEANENALRIALQLTHRTQIASLYGSFHGRST